LSMMMVIHAGVVHVGQYSMMERSVCQEGKADDCDFDEVAL
jgi:hypothetical protein